MKYLFLSQAFYPTISMLFSENSIIYSVIQFPNVENPNNLLYITKVMFDLLKEDKNAIDGICVVNGPGSFTGTRIGVVDAKILAFALNKPLYPINALDLIGRHVPYTAYVLLSASKKEFFVALFENGKRKTEDTIMGVDEIKQLGVKVVSVENLEMFGFKDFNRLHIDPEVVRTVALEHILSGQSLEDPLSLRPIYLRAEDKLFKKMR